MPRYNIYLKQEAEDNLQVIFEHLKMAGEIPANATEIGEYRAQCISYALGYTAAFDPMQQELLRKYQQMVGRAGQEMGIAHTGDSLIDDVLPKLIALAKRASKE